MKTLAFTLLALIAAALTVAGCAKQADDANATALNELTLNDSDGADSNLTATDSLDANTGNSNATDTTANAL